MSEESIVFKVGMAKVDVTPSLGCLLYGYPRERHADKVMDKLYVSVAAFEQGEKTILLISADVCAMNYDKCRDIRKVVGKAIGVNWTDILYATIHTHSGPVTRTSKGWGETDEDYLDNTLIPASIEAAKKALTGMQPAKMGIGTTESMAGINRRQVTTGKEVILGQNPDGPYDPTMTVISFCSVDNESIGSIVHFAAHPTAAGSNFSITRDWPGVMVDRMEEITDAPCIYLNGAEGDVGPRLSNGKTTGDESSVEEIGQVAAADAERAYRSIDSYRMPALQVSHGNILLPFIKPPAYGIVKKRMEDMGDPQSLKDTDISQYAQLQKMKEIYEAGCMFPSGMEISQTLIALDNLAMVPVCFEAFADVALALKEISPYANTLLLGLTSGSCGYLPTKDQIAYGGYEVASFRAAGVISFVDDTDQQVISQNASLLHEMYAAASMKE